MKLGVLQTLVVVNSVEFGVYLADVDDLQKENKVLLPKKQVPAYTKVGDEVEVFLYRDSNDRLIATRNTPKITMGQIARLRVVEVGKFGAFLDWGLEKDLFLPFKEQTRKVQAEEEVLVALYADKSNRLCATMNVYEFLAMDSPYKKDDQVKGVVYQVSDNFGAFVAVDDRYSALIPKKELYGTVAIGEEITARVAAVKADGKLDLSIRDKAYVQINSDGEAVLAAIDSFGGALPFNDKATPEVINREMHMSKNEFKRAVGHLLKEKKIEITEKGIKRV